MKMYLSGADSIAQAVRLCRVEVMSAYPITPNTPALQAIYELIEKGEIEADSVNAESELGSMLICAGAAAVGVRTFNCTAAQGLALMKEPLWMASGMALPVVLAVVSRQLGSPQGLLSDFSDCFSERDASVIQYVCENNQEIIDNHIIAYKVSEDTRILLPAFVVLEGFRLSHSYELVEVPEQELVDRYLPKYDPKHAFVDADYPISQGGGAFAHYYGLKFQQYRAMDDAREVIIKACEEFGRVFGREHPGLVEAYRTEDAEMIVVGMGTVVSMLRDVVDEYRERGVPIGLLKIRVFRPFPEDEVASILAHARKVLVIDRAVTPGRKGGISFVEVKSSLGDGPSHISNYIIGGKDVNTKDCAGIVQEALDAPEPFVKWHGQVFDERASVLTGYPNYVALVEKGERLLGPKKPEEPLMAQGTTVCPGCVSLGAIKTCLEVFDEKTVATDNAGCLTAASTIFPITAWRTPHIFFTYSNAGAAASGMEVALKRLGKEIKVFLIGGDGGLFDIGLQTFSAALERGHEIVYVCYDNEAYMNTGVQRSGSTPWLAKTKTTPFGKSERKKNLMKIVEAHGDVYAATASPAFPQDLRRKLQKAKELKKPAFIHILCPCPTGWEYPEEEGIELARLSVETNFFPLYEYDNGVITVRKSAKKPKPVEAYLRRQGRFRHLSDEEIGQIQRRVDQDYQELLRREEMSRRECGEG